MGQQVPVGTKIRPSDFFGDGTDGFGDGTDDFGDGNDWRSPESLMAPMSVFNRFPIIPDHQVSEECITDGPTDKRKDGQTDGRTGKR